jgi:hypothetical protein
MNFPPPQRTGTRLRSLVAATALLAALPSLAGQPAGDVHERVSVRIGRGCIDVPRSYRVVRIPSSIIDQSHGYVDAPNKPRVEWSSGMSEALPPCHGKCNTLWQRKETLGRRERVVGLLEDAGAKAFFVIDEFTSFRVNSDKTAALDYLRELTAAYQIQADPGLCDDPESP